MSATTSGRSGGSAIGAATTSRLVRTISRTSDRWRGSGGAGSCGGGGSRGGVVGALARGAGRVAGGSGARCSAISSMASTGRGAAARRDIASSLDT
jgi:hypothetical protein